jgi:hypothetical protein
VLEAHFLIVETWVNIYACVRQAGSATALRMISPRACFIGAVEGYLDEESERRSCLMR